MFKRLLALLGIAAATFGCSEAATDKPDAEAASCEDRRGGALITFCDVAPPGMPRCASSEPEHVMTIWVTNNAYIDEAIYKLNHESTRSSVWFLQDGVGCDENHSWHANPATVRFQDVTAEGCNAFFKDVDNNKEFWLHTFTEGNNPEGMFCPQADVGKVIDLR